MILISQKATLIKPENQNGITLLKQVEQAGRTCWQSHDRMTDESYERFIRQLIKNGHESPLEFADLSFKLTTSRAVLAELTRHRLASFQVESQRYVKQDNEDGQVRFIRPDWYSVDNLADEASIIGFDALARAEHAYKKLLKLGFKPEQARDVLPNACACDIIVKANLREWRHIFALRCSQKAYPPTRKLCLSMLKQAKEYVPFVFDDLPID